VAPTGIASNDPLGQTFGTHPTVAKRHHRVVRMGATGSAQGTTSSSLSGVSGPRRLLVGVLLAILTVLLIALVPLMLYLMIAVTLFALVVGMLFVMIVLAPLR
jgi:hypothetical protein